MKVRALLGLLKYERRMMGWVYFAMGGFILIISFLDLFATNSEDKDEKYWLKDIYGAIVGVGMILAASVLISKG